MFRSKGKLMVVAVLSLFLICAVFAEQASARQPHTAHGHVTFSPRSAVVTDSISVMATFSLARFRIQETSQRFVRFNYAWTQSTRRPANSEFTSRRTANPSTFTQDAPGTWYLHVLATFTMPGGRGGALPDATHTVYRRGGPYVVKQ